MASHQQKLTLNDLPDEVLQHILIYLSPRDTIWSIQRLSKRFNRLGTGLLLWRYHCRVEFKYWDSKHQINQKFLGSLGNVDWRLLYKHRMEVDREITATLDSILEGQTNRIEKYGTIGDFGYDAKDTLLRHCSTSEAADDVLARRYYATAVLDHVHRSKALAEWFKLASGENVSLERALGAFDLFVLHDQPGDLLEICEIFDDLAVKVRLECPNFEELTPRKKALAIASFLRVHNLTGLTSDLAYRDLQNSYIGIALRDGDHPSLPLISVAIFCTLARRLGLDARCCGMPNHVHAMVFPKPLENLDGRLAESRSDGGPMYLDPYRSDVEVPVQHLLETLASWGIQPVEFLRFISDASTPSLVLRTSKNILATVHEFRDQGASAENRGHPTIRIYANPFADMDDAFYSALWANFMLGHPESSRGEGTTQRQFIPLILERFERLYPMDASLIEKYVCPVLSSQSGHSAAEHNELIDVEVLRIVRLADQTPKQVRARNKLSAPDKVKYKVGQVFRHKRYAFNAVITGWDIECGKGSEWMEHNVDSLSKGTNQSFYYALVENSSIRYVAEENIEITEPELPLSLIGIAGKFFKRWDKEERVFVSNIRDEYPED